MNSENIMIDIISLCKEIDAMAASIYYNFSSTCEDDALCSIWTKMREEEREHVRYWQHLLDLVNIGAIPQLFDDPELTKNELEELIPTVTRYLVESRYPMNTSIAFQIASRLELFMLGRPIVYLYLYLQSMMEDKTPADDYERHLTEDGYSLDWTNPNI